MNMTGAELARLLRQIANRVDFLDTMEGTLAWEATESRNVYEVTAAFRGVGAVVINPTKDTDHDPR